MVSFTLSICIYIYTCFSAQHQPPRQLQPQQRGGGGGGGGEKELSGEPKKEEDGIDSNKEIVC